MADESIYLGLPGALQKIWWPSGGIDGSRLRATSTFPTGSGGMRVSKLLNGVRTYALDYAALHRNSFAVLEAYDQGLMGPGPFVFLDPGRRNLLTANQAGATSLTNDTRDFTNALQGTISSDSSQLALPRPRSLKYSFATTVSSTLLTLDSPTKVWPGVPILTGRSYTFTAKTFGLVGSMDFQMQIAWLDLLGTTTLATATSGAVSSVVGAWTPFWVTATPPAGTVWAQCQINPVNGTIAAGEGVLFSDFMLNEGPREPWVPGTGIYPVQVMSQRDIQPFAAPEFRKGNTLVLQEVR